MTTFTKNASPILFALALALGATACGSDASTGGEDGAYLTIQGDSNLFLEPGYQRALAVQYHDGQGKPLTGEVTFEVVGEAKGSTLSKDYGATNASGEASLTLFAGELETVFRIKASAEFAASVEWTVSVSEGAVARDLDIRGEYELDSDFDIINGLPGKVGTVVNTFVDMTDGPNDPATFVLDKIMASQSGTVANLVGALRPGLDAIINDVIKDNAPGIVNDLLGLGSDFGQVARKFGIVSTMNVNGDSIEANSMTAVHTIGAYSFELDSQTYIFTMNELGVDTVVVENISVGLNASTGAADFAQHEVPMQYGGFLAMALEEVIIPRIDPQATDLKSLLQNKVDCAAVGASLAANVGIFGAGFYETTCNLGIEAAASFIMEELRDIDDRAQVNMLISGATTMKDPSGDGKADSMTQGNWSGAMEYLGQMGALAEGANPFTGARMN